MSDDVLSSLSAEDADRILYLNNEHAVETSLLDLTAAERLLAMCFYAKCVSPGMRGFLLALDQDAAYDNQNFHWFRRRFERFVYIDRVIVAQDARGQGLARLMYEDLFAEAKAAGHVRVVCEVNIDGVRCSCRCCAEGRQQARPVSGERSRLTCSISAPLLPRLSSRGCAAIPPRSCDKRR
jgi:hypothetical protein